MRRANMKFSPLIKQFVLACSVLLFATAAQAKWTLDPAASTLSFASIKAGSVGEAHRFTELAGTVDKNGAVTITVALDSVETMIDIRDERMRKFLFETAQFPTATITAELDMKALKKLKVGDTTSLDLPVKLALHGQASHVDTVVTVARLAHDRVLVTSRDLIMIDASGYGFDEGLQKLMELAGLPSISSAVPVSFVFLFDKGGKAE